MSQQIQPQKWLKNGGTQTVEKWPKPSAELKAIRKEKEDLQKQLESVKAENVSLREQLDQAKAEMQEQCEVKDKQAGEILIRYQEAVKKMQGRLK